MPPSYPDPPPETQYGPISWVYAAKIPGEDNLGFTPPSGSFWTKPAGEAFDHGERPVNLDASNLVWLDARTTPWIDLTDGPSPQVSFLWGDPQDDHPAGALLKLPAGFTGELRTDAAEFRAVVIQGTPALGDQDLEPGSYFASADSASHALSATTTENTLLYIRTNGRFEITASTQP